VTPVTAADLDRWEALAAAATPGPWERDITGHTAFVIDCEFIATSRTAVAALVAALREALETNARLNRRSQIAEAAILNESLQKAAEVNSLEKFQLVFRQVLESLFIERMELNEDLFSDYMGKPEMQELVSKWLGSQVYDRLAEARKAGR